MIEVKAEVLKAKKTIKKESTKMMIKPQKSKGQTLMPFNKIKSKQRSWMMSRPFKNKIKYKKLLNRQSQEKPLK